MKRIVALLVVTGLLAATAVAVYAETATVSVTAGTLSVDANDVTLSAVVLDGGDKTATSASGSNSWAAEDARGTGVGWHLTIDATDFTDAAKTINISATDQEFKIQLLDTNIAVVTGNAKPTSSVTSLTAIPEAPASALTFASAAVNEGMGSYTLNPNFELEVPAETLAGSYSSTITVSAVSGP
ncbi:MAG TPA: WxL domain-containing protein [Dehalococcoidia bacterium]|nr:WxL domain-containing protein [Dehalococcoidia bacterium]